MLKNNLKFLLFSVNATYFTQSGESLTKSLSPCETNLGLFNNPNFSSFCKGGEFLGSIGGAFL